MPVNIHRERDLESFPWEARFQFDEFQAQLDRNDLDLNNFTRIVA